MSNTDFSSFFDVLEEDPFIEHPVDVRTFVRDQKYLGQPELSEIQYTLIETMSQIFKEEDLKRFMGDAEGANHYKKYTKNEIIMQLGKGSGKDFTSTVGCAYVVYKLLCLKSPATYFGKPSGDAIDIINVAINAQQAKNVFFKGFKSKIERSPWFAGKYYAKMDSIEFDESITVYSGHSERESHEGLNLLMAVLDEISGFSMESASGNDQGKTADNIYTAFRASVDSRFPDYGKVVLLSFPRYKGDFISNRYESVIAEKNTYPREHHFILNPDLPSDDPDNNFSVTWDEDEIISYKIPGVIAIKRPTWEVNPTRKIEDFKLQFYTNPGDALMRFACMPGEATDTFFKSRDKIEKMLCLRNPVDQFRRFDDSFKIDDSKVYYIHADLAQKHDKCAVAVSHVEKWVKLQTFNDYEQIVPFIVTDVIAWWEPQREGPVDLSEVKNWIIDLRRRGMNIGLVTFDRWNSFDIQRDLKDIGIRTDTLSVAKKHYEDLSMLVYEERVAAPHIDILKDELLELRIMRNDRVDHPRKKSKDLADALCGSVYNCISHSRRENTREINIHTWSSSNKDRKNEMPQEPKKQEMSEEIRDYLGKFNLI
jgi:hypothetical protein